MLEMAPSFPSPPRDLRPWATERWGPVHDHMPRTWQTAPDKYLLNEC